MSGVVGSPEDTFSRDEAQVFSKIRAGVTVFLR